MPPVPDLWIFGYGSLVWRPDFPAVEARAASLDGLGRRFWQHSTDHRGVPGAPGRVVTLVASEERTWGRAFRVDPAHAAEVLARLDHRERGGYERATWTVRDPAGAAFADALVYRATATNPNWAGPAPIEAIAAQVAAAVGPSGPNPEYVLKLEVALRELQREGVDTPLDAHTEAVAAAVRRALG